jgi:hypothetical protein
MKKKIKLKDRVVCQCKKCNKPFSFDVNKGYSFGSLCRECATKKRKDGEA